MRMPSRGQVLDSPHISRPFDLRWILRPGKKEPAIGSIQGRRDEEFIQLWLAIGGVGSHVAEIALISAVNAPGGVIFRVEAGIEREGGGGVGFLFYFVQDLAPREA